MADENVDSGQGPTEEQINEAKSLGWAPKEEWRGAEEKWVDADEFLKRGLGIHHLREQNKKLESTIGQFTGRLSSLEQALRAANATIETLEASHNEDTKAQVEAARAELKEQLADASREGRHEDVAEITDKIAQLNNAEDTADGKEKKGGKDGDGNEPPAIHPEVKAWFSENPEFVADKRRVALANVVAAELRQGGDTRIGKVFMDAVAEEVEKTLGPVKRGTSKAEGGNGGSGRKGGDGSGGGKSYNDLPAEAKEACERMGKRLVGPNRAHKDLDSWRKSYAKQYFAQG